MNAKIIYLGQRSITLELQMIFHTIMIHFMIYI